MDQNIASQVTGSAWVGATVTSVASSPTYVTTGVVSSTVSLIALASTGTIQQGDVFTMAGVYAVNPQNFQSTGSLQQFTALASQTSAGTTLTALPVYPPIILTGPFQTVTAAPATSGAVTFIGGTGASVTSPQSLLFHKEAFAMACADLPLPGGVDMAQRVSDQELGLSIRLIRAYDINQDRFPLRIDFLYGWTTLYPQLAARIWG
jgi:hypothetical protein